MYVGLELFLFMLLTISNSGELLGADRSIYDPIFVLHCFTWAICIYVIRILKVIVYRAVKHSWPCLPAAEAEQSGASAKLPYFRRSGNNPKPRIAAVSRKGVCGRRCDGRYKFLCGQLFIVRGRAYVKEMPCGKRCRRACV